jgi:uncharacterized membrane protein
MPRIERSIHVDASADALFRYLADVEHLPDYFPDIVAAEPEQGERVHVAAKIPDGTTRDGEAWFRVDEGARRIEWGSEDDSGYHGWIEVGDDGQGSEVRLGLHMHHEDVDDSIGRTLAQIRENVEGAGRAT